MFKNKNTPINNKPIQEKVEVRVRSNGRRKKVKKVCGILKINLFLY